MPSKDWSFIDYSTIIHLNVTFALAACSVSLCRHKQLEDILVLAKQFHETAEPISDFLSVTEKKLANSEPVGTQTAKIQQQIIRHKVGSSYGK